MEGFEPSRYGVGDQPAQPSLIYMASSGFAPEFPTYEDGVGLLHYEAATLRGSNSRFRLSRPGCFRYTKRLIRS